VAVWQANGQDLVWPDRAVIARRAVEHVVERTGVLIGKVRKTCVHPFGKVAVSLGRSVERLGESRHHAQCVVPQRIDLDRFADARRHHPVAELGVHPGELHSGHAGAQQRVRRIHSNAVARAANVPFDDVGEDRKHVRETFPVATDVEISAPRLDEPQGSVDRVAVRFVARARKDIVACLGRQTVQR
jgi:hypothetical protein